MNVSRILYLILYTLASIKPLFLLITAQNAEYPDSEYIDFYLEDVNNNENKKSRRINFHFNNLVGDFMPELLDLYKFIT